MTRAERRRMERESGSRTTYQFTLEQIECMKRQAVLDAKEKMKEEIAKEIDEHIQEEWKQRAKLLQFSEAIVKEVNRICGDENADIRKYRDETYELYGVKYEVK